MLLALIVEYASKHGRRPSAVYQDYLEHPRDYQLIWSYENWRAEEQKKEMEQAQSKARR
jgi:hypothetical protein